jgi:hypothetical protein
MGGKILGIEALSSDGRHPVFCSFLRVRPFAEKTFDVIFDEQRGHRRERCRLLHPPEEKWYQREDVQFLLLTLAILGIAIAAGATVAIAFGGGGLHAGASK